MTTVDLGVPAVAEPVDAQSRPKHPGLLDRFGRIATDLRVSLTDRCNLRCDYCMPAQGLDWLPNPQLLTDDELIRLISIAVTELGVTDIRFTGGEPLLRRGLPDLVAATAALKPRPRISMTTNGIGLARQGRCAGRRRTGPGERLAGHAAAGGFRLDHPAGPAGRRAGRTGRRGSRGHAPVKVNAVLLRGINDDEAVDLLRYCVEHGYHLRFIEQMPLDPQHGWDRSQLVTAERSSPNCAQHSLSPRYRHHGGSLRRKLAGGRRRSPRHGRPDSFGDKAVLRGLRPNPADRGRPDPQLPFCQTRKPTCAAHCAPAPPTRS